MAIESTWLDWFVSLCDDQDACKKGGNTPRKVKPNTFLSSAMFEDSNDVLHLSQNPFFMKSVKFSSSFFSVLKLVF